MRWLYHLLATGDEGSPGARFAPSSLAREGFLHASYRPAIADTARLYFPRGLALDVLQIDPRRLDVRVEEAATPRGPMPHLHGAIPGDAIHARLSLAATAEAPDRVTGTRIACVAFRGVTLLDLVGVWDPLSRIAGLGIDPTARCAVISADDPAPWSAGGATLTVEAVRPDLADYDLLVVAGGPGTRLLLHDRAAIEWLASYPANRLAASVCTGALLLGAAGRLRGRRATTHATALDQLSLHGAVAVRERVVDEGQLVTAGGVTAGIDLGLHLVARLHGDEARHRIAAQMEHP